MCIRILLKIPLICDTNCSLQTRKNDNCSFVCLNRQTENKSEIIFMCSTFKKTSMFAEHVFYKNQQLDRGCKIYQHVFGLGESRNVLGKFSVLSL